MNQVFKAFCCTLATCAMMLFATSCTKEVMTKDAFFEGLFVKRTITAEATLPSSGDADRDANAEKAYVDSNSLKVIWQASDQLSINGTLLTVSSIDSGGACAKFYGTVNGMVDGDNLRYWAVYPSSIAPTLGYNPPTNTLSFTLPATQTIDTTKQALEGYSYMVGHTKAPQTANRLHFQMRNLGAVLKLTLAADANDFSKRVDSIVFTCATANLTGNFTIDTNSNNPTIAATNTGSNKLVVEFTGGSLDISTAKTVYVFLPPMSGNLNMRIYGGYGLATFVEKNIASANLARNNIYTSTCSGITFDHYFTVSSSNDKVLFAPGNLQWSRTNGTSSDTTHAVAGGVTADGTWRFALHQWDFVGCHVNHNWGNVYGVGGNSTTKCSNDNPTASYSGWIDLFGYGTSGYSSKYPYLTTASNSSYINENFTGNYINYDWGVYNAIDNPQTGETYAPATWRTLTRDEWNYVLFTRATNSGAENSSNAKRYAKATVNGVIGLILLPDDWNTSTYTLANYDTKNAKWSRSTKITAAQWPILEGAGVIFLPTTLYRNGNTVKKACEIFDANYWSATKGGKHPLFDSTTVKVKDDCERYYGHAVRLAHDAN